MSLAGEKLVFTLLPLSERWLVDAQVSFVDYFNIVVDDF
jgi:hypothetical protein